VQKYNLADIVSLKLFGSSRANRSIRRFCSCSAQSDAGGECSDIQEDECVVISKERAVIDHEEADRKRRHSAKTVKTGCELFGETVYLTPAEREKQLEKVLDASWAVYYPRTASSRDHLISALETLALARCERSYKQLSMIIVGREKDLAHDSVMHAIKKIEAGKYHGKGNFNSLSGWPEFANSDPLGSGGLYPRHSHWREQAEALALPANRS